MRFFGVNFILQKFCSCKKNDKYQVCIGVMGIPLPDDDDEFYCDYDDGYCQDGDVNGDDDVYRDDDDSC